MLPGQESTFTFVLREGLSLFSSCEDGGCREADLTAAAAAVGGGKHSTSSQIGHDLEKEPLAALPLKQTLIHPSGPLLWQINEQV